MIIEREEALDYYSDNENWARVPDTTVGDVTFSDGTDKVIEHAVAMKRYNGIGIVPSDPSYNAGNRQYCEWREIDHAWYFNPIAYYYYSQDSLILQDYVGSVCSQFP